jgi:hypothetical protein
MPELKFIILVIVVLIANVVEAVTGFGSTIIAVTICANFYPIDFLVPVLVPANLLMSGYIVGRHWRHISARVLFVTILPIVSVGVAGGLYLFNSMGTDKLKLVFGIFVLAFSSFQLVRHVRMKEGEEPAPLGRAQTGLWLFGGGIMQGMYASGGPMVVYYASRVFKDKGTFRATLSCLWLIINICMSISYYFTGKMTPATLRMSGLVLPCILLGIVIGEMVHKRIPERMFRIVVYALLIVAGAALVLGG